MEKSGYVYIIASQKYGTLYTGVTSDLIKRIKEHKAETYKGFTEKYGVKMLVWYEYFPTIEQAITQEKKIKTWQRAWKVRLIEEANPEWIDLSTTLVPK